MELVTQAAYARHRGVSREAVRVAVLKGRIPTVDGKIDPKAADRAWAANTDTSKPKNSVNGKPKLRARKQAATTGFALHRATNEEYKAKMAELDYLHRSGKLLDRAQVEKAVFEQNRRARDRLKLIVSRIGALLPPEVREMLRKEIRDACDELAGA